MAATATASAPALTSSARLKRMGAEALYLLTGFAMSIVAFTVWVTGMTLSLTLGLLIVGSVIGASVRRGGPTDDEDSRDH